MLPVEAVDTSQSMKRLLAWRGAFKGLQVADRGAKKTGLLPERSCRRWEGQPKAHRPAGGAQGACSDQGLAYLLKTLSLSHVWQPAASAMARACPCPTNPERPASVSAVQGAGGAGVAVHGAWSWVGWGTTMVVPSMPSSLGLLSRPPRALQPTLPPAAHPTPPPQPPVQPKAAGEARGSLGRGWSCTNMHGRPENPRPPPSPRPLPPSPRPAGPWKMMSVLCGRGLKHGTSFQPTCQHAPSPHTNSAKPTRCLV